jgi:hypothetical protein
MIMMKRTLASLSLVLLVCACASSSTDSVKPPPIAPPTMELAQLADPSLITRGSVQLRYTLAVTNNADEQLTLRRVELRTVGGGLYQLPNRSINVTLVIPPHSTEIAPFTLWGNGNGSVAMHAVEPTTLRGMAYFDSPSGLFQQHFEATLDLAGAR